MNRYLLAALYVMAGCAVSVPLKAQQHGELLKVERCRLVITHTVKVVSVCLDEETEDSFHYSLLADYFLSSFLQVAGQVYYYPRTIDSAIGSLCRTSYKIRAPGE